MQISLCPNKKIIDKEGEKAYNIFGFGKYGKVPNIKKECVYYETDYQERL
jgi:hypothetical protein